MSDDDFARKIAALGQFRCADPVSLDLSEADRHHLFRVLRAREGEEVVVGDGAGRYLFARVVRGGLEAASDVQVAPRPEPTTLYLAPLKGDRSEWAVAKATELGISTVVPLLSERVAARWRDGAGERALVRWRRVAHEAAGIARRAYDLEIAPALTVAEVPDDVAVCDFGGAGTLEGVSAVAVGPEGGWSPGEWPASRRFLGLGRLVLRGDTAAVAAATLLVANRAGWPRHAGGSPVGNDEGR